MKELFKGFSKDLLIAIIIEKVIITLVAGLIAIPIICLLLAAQRFLLK